MKQGANKSLDDCHEYDIDSWLQYAQYVSDDPLDKGCCPDFFGYWSSSPFLPQGQHVAVGDMGFSEIQGSLNKAETSRTKERSGTSLRSASSEAGVAAPLLKATNAAAVGTLASRGADSLSRATGGSAIRADGAPGMVFPQSNRDAFITKARASMAQTFSGSQTDSIPVVNASSVASLQSCAIMSQSSFHLPSSKSLENPTALKSTAGSNKRYLHSIVDELRNQQQQRPQPMAGLRSQVSNAIAMGMRTTQPHAMPFSSCSKYAHDSLSRPPTQRPSNPQESGCSHVTDMHKMSDNMSSASNQWDILQQRVTSSATTDSYADGSEMEPCSSVQGLRVGTTSNIREELRTGKRKQDDECPSEDAEGESMETRHLTKFSSSKRNRAAEVHNLSEKNRRNRINEKLKALQDLIPNSSKTDKASILDEAIEYLKNLQMQLQMVSMKSGIAVSPMMIPVGMPHLQMAPLHSVGIGVPIGHAGMGIRMGMGVGVGLHMSAAGMGMNMVMPQVTVNPSSHQSDPSTRIHSRPASHDRVLNSLSDDGEVPTISDFNPSESMQSHSQTQQFEFAEPGSYATFNIPHHRHQL